MADKLLALRDLTAPLEVDAPWPGTPVSGDPHTKTWNLYTSDDGKLLAGIWESIRRTLPKSWDSSRPSRTPWTP